MPRFQVFREKRSHTLILRPAMLSAMTAQKGRSTPDAWIHEQVPVLADAVQVCKQADLQILTLYSVLPAKTSAQLEQQLEELLRGKDVQQSVVSIIADLEQERE